MDSRTRRRARTALVGGALAILTLAGHLAGGGGIDPLGTALVVVLALGLGWALSGAPLSWLRLFAVLLAGQGFLHLVLTFATGHAHGGSTMSATTMIAAHVVAAAVATVLVRNADLLIDRWSALVTAAIGADRPRTHRPAIAPTTAVRGLSQEHCRLLYLEHRVHRRGPPSLGVLLPA